MTTAPEGFARSADGTTIAYERTGRGPALILVEAAAHYRAFSSFTGLTDLLADHFTVYRYDRRGRGDSTDTLPYSVDREVDDLAALIEAAGGSAYLYGFSSGALLGLHAAARGLGIPRLALLEPPLDDDETRAPRSLTIELAELVDAGRHSDAVEHFQMSIGVPDEIIEDSRGTPAWKAMESVAHTLVYDCRISEATAPEVFAAVTAPTLVLDSDGSTDNLSGWASMVAARLPNATHRSLTGEWHGLADGLLAPVLTEFFTDSTR
ncbi:MAG: alpha/beta fold hydrolase [Nocardioidaceae bacterium]